AAISVPELDNRINEQKRQLDEMLRKYTDQHPDVVSTKRLLTQLLEDRKHEIEVRSKAAESEPGSPLTGDPVAQQLKVALNDAEPGRAKPATAARRSYRSVAFCRPRDELAGEPDASHVS